MFHVVILIVLTLALGSSRKFGLESESLCWSGRPRERNELCSSKSRRVNRDFERLEDHAILVFVVVLLLITILAACFVLKNAQKIAEKASRVLFRRGQVEREEVKQKAKKKNKIGEEQDFRLMLEPGRRKLPVHKKTRCVIKKNDVFVAKKEERGGKLGGWRLEERPMQAAEMIEGPPPVKRRKCSGEDSKDLKWIPFFPVDNCRYYYDCETGKFLYYDLLVSSSSGNEKPTRGPSKASATRRPREQHPHRKQ